MASTTVSRRQFITAAAAGTAGLIVAQNVVPGTAQAAAPAIPQTFTDGTYLTKVISMHGAINVKTEIADGKIASVVILNNNESFIIGEQAIQEMPKRIVASQCIDVDGVTGSTITSRAIKAAVEQAIINAGGDPEQFEGYVAPEVVKTEVSKDVDVAVVGGGMAGLMAAWELAKQGKKVTIFEKMPYVGGCMPITSTAWNAQETKIQLAWGTDQMSKKWASIEAQIESYRTDRVEADSPYANPELPFVTPMFYAIRDATDMMIDAGVGFCPISVWPAPQMAPGAFSIGGKYCVMIVENFITHNLGVEIIKQAPVKELVMDGDKVCGLVAEGVDGTVYNVSAKAVVLASGGYIMNPELMAEYQADDLKYPLMGPAWATGDGLLMGKAAGAAWETMDQGVTSHYSGGVSMAEISYIHYVAPGYVVNGNGARFVSESMEYKQALRLFKQQETDDFYWIFDEISRQGMVPTGNSYRLDYTFLFETGDLTVADNYQDLAQKLNLPELVATLDEINANVASGTPDPFGNTKIRKTLVDGPMYALKVTPTPYIAQGGLKIDTACHVQREDGSNIAGLYAAGDVTGSTENRDGCMYRVGLTQAIAFGLIAGRTVAAEL